MNWREPLLARQKVKNGSELESCNDPALSSSNAPITVDASADDAKRNKSLEHSKSNNVQHKNVLWRCRPSYMHISRKKKKLSQSAQDCASPSSGSFARKKSYNKKSADTSLRFFSAERNKSDARRSVDQGAAASGDVLLSGGRGCCASQLLVSQEEEKEEASCSVLKKQPSEGPSLRAEETEPHGAAGGTHASHCSSMSCADGETSLEEEEEEERCLLINSLDKQEASSLHVDAYKLDQGCSEEKETKTNSQQALQEEKEKHKSLQDMSCSGARVEESGRKESLSLCPALINCACIEPREVSSVVPTPPVFNSKDDANTSPLVEVHQEEEEEKEGLKEQPQSCVMTPTIANGETPLLTVDVSALSKRDADFNNPSCSDYSNRACGFTPEVNSLLCQLVEEHVLASLVQNVENMMVHRQAELRHVAECLSQVIGHVASSKGISYNALRYYVFGSVAMCTVLPDGDNDMTIEIDGLCGVQQNLGKGGSFTEAECFSAANKNNDVSNSDEVSSSQAAVIAASELFSGVADYLRQHDTQLYVEALVVAEVRVLKLVKNGSCFDITLGQLGGVDCVRFLHELDLEIGCNHLLKRTLLLLRAWCCYEAHVLSGQGGYMSSYAATIMLIAMMNTVEFLEDVEQEEKEKENNENDAPQPQKCKEFKNVSPFQLFARFLKFFSYFDFEHYCVTVFGPLPCSSITGKNLDLSCLEVPAARDTAASAKSCEFLGKDVRDDDCLEQSFDVNVLGLTEEGQNAIGDRIRRRAKPFVTVSGVKHLLHDEHLRRQCRSANSVEMSCKTEKGVFCKGNTVGDGAINSDRPRLNRRGSAVEDSSLLCSSCNTKNYPLRIMNVMDPLRWSASLSRGVCRNHLQRIRRAFREGLKLFGMASTKMLNETFVSSVSDTSSGTGLVESEVACNTASYSDTTNGHADQFDSFSLTKMGILQEIFGQTLRMLERYSPVVKCPPLPLRHAHCGQCQKPSFFCVSDAKQVCEPQYVFEVAKSTQEEGGKDFVDCSRACGHSDGPQASSLVSEVLQQHHRQHHHYHHHHHHHQQQQQQHQGHYCQRQPQQQRQDQQQQLNMLPGSLPLMPAQMSPMMSPASSYADPLKIADFLRLNGWHGVGNHAYGGDISVSPMAPAPHFARGAPLLRTGAKSASGAKSKAANFSAPPANGQFFVFPGHNVLPCYQGYTANGAAACFAPPPPFLQPPPSCVCGGAALQPAPSGGYCAKGPLPQKPATREIGT